MLFFFSENKVIWIKTLYRKVKPNEIRNTMFFKVINKWCSDHLHFTLPELLPDPTIDKGMIWIDWFVKNSNDVSSEDLKLQKSQRWIQIKSLEAAYCLTTQENTCHLSPENSLRISLEKQISQRSNKKQAMIWIWSSETGTRKWEGLYRDRMSSAYFSVNLHNLTLIWSL